MLRPVLSCQQDRLHQVKFSFRRLLRLCPDRRYVTVFNNVNNRYWCGSEGINGSGPLWSPAWAMVPSAQRCPVFALSKDQKYCSPKNELFGEIFEANLDAFFASS